MQNETGLDDIIDKTVAESFNSSPGDDPTISDKFLDSEADLLLFGDDSAPKMMDIIVTTLEERGQNTSDFIEKIYTQIKNEAEDASSESEPGEMGLPEENPDISTESGLYKLGRYVIGLITEGEKWVRKLTRKAGETLGPILEQHIFLYSGIAQAAITTFTTDYVDGISETEYGALMQSSWVGTSRSFLDTYMNGDLLNRKIKVMKNTPLDPGEDGRSALFGTLIMGTPYTYGGYSDPRNRQYINTFIKDGRIVTFTPGFPNYNGGYNFQRGSDPNDTTLTQTKNGSEMLDYLLKNGLDKTFTEKDKRFYTFKADFETYYSYLEAMLTPIWLKLGLGTGDDNTFNIFSFFKIKKDTNDDIGDIDPTGHATLKNRYRSSVGFYLNGPAGVAEAISSDQTSFGSTTSGYINEQSDAYQEINYFTGMGNKNMRHARIGGATRQLFTHGRDVLNQQTEMARGLGNVVRGKAKGVVGAARYLAGWATGFVMDTISTGSRKDLSSIVQSFAVSNGLKTIHPELWSDSSYSKSINLTFEFVSPYGDPMSIFKYVYVPFCSLLALALPRAAADNGYVSPMFVRCDIPGHITSDLALISDMTWVKGGSSNIWSKDNLPRAISVNLTVSDLYPFLAMSKRFSFLSANPSFAVFLDNMAGLCSIYDENMKDDPLNAYFDRLLKRVNGLTEDATLWNKAGELKKKYYKSSSNDVRKSVTSRLDSGIRYTTISYLDRF